MLQCGAIGSVQRMWSHVQHDMQTSPTVQEAQVLPMQGLHAGKTPDIADWGQGYGACWYYHITTIA